MAERLWEPETVTHSSCLTQLPCLSLILGPEHGQSAAQEEALPSYIQWNTVLTPALALTLCLSAFGANIFLALCQSKKPVLTS